MLGIVKIITPAEHVRSRRACVRHSSSKINHSTCKRAMVATAPDSGHLVPAAPQERPATLDSTRNPIMAS